MTEHIKMRGSDMSDNEEVIKLQRRLEQHLDTYRNDAFIIEARFVKHEAMQEKNLEAIDRLTATTQGVVDAWVFANGFHRFIKWLSGFAFLGGAIAWLQHTFK